MPTCSRVLAALLLATPLLAMAQQRPHPQHSQPLQVDAAEEQLLQSIPKSMSKASGAANELVDSLVMSSQIIAGAQQIRSAFIWARTDNFEAQTILDLVKRNYLKGVPPPFSPDSRIDGSVLRMSPVSLPLCLSLEQKAGRRGTTFFDSSIESASLYGCYLSNNIPVVFYRL
jgi:hypothetical protein